MAANKICKSNGVQLERKASLKLFVGDVHVFVARCLLLEVVVKYLLNHKRHVRLELGKLRLGIIKAELGLFEVGLELFDVG